MQRALSLFIITIVCSLALTAQESTGNVEWSFPRPGMRSQKFDSGEIRWDLGNNFYASFNPSRKKEPTTVLVFLPNNLDELINNVNANEPSAINVNQFKTAIAVEKAVVTPPGQINEFLGARQVGSDTFYIYRTNTGAIVGAGLLNNSLVTLFPVPKGKRLKQ